MRRGAAFAAVDNAGADLCGVLAAKCSCWHWDVRPLITDTCSATLSVDLDLSSSFRVNSNVTEISLPTHPRTQAKSQTCAKKLQLQVVQRDSASCSNEIASSTSWGWPESSKRVLSASARLFSLVDRCRWGAGVSSSAPRASEIASSRSLC
jgi:hypothetical protein